MQDRKKVFLLYSKVTNQNFMQNLADKCSSIRNVSRVSSCAVADGIIFKLKI